MLPNIRALFGAIVAAVALLMISFGVVATFRVAREARVGMLQADLAHRGRMPDLAMHDPSRVVLTEKLDPLEPNPVMPVESAQDADISLEAPQVVQAPENPTSLAFAVEVEPQASTQLVAETPADVRPTVRPSATETVQTEQPAEIVTIEQLIAEFAPPALPMGGPLAEQNVTHAKPRAPNTVQSAAARMAKKKAEQAAARKARAQRLARERKAAAGKARAAQARAKRQTARSFDNAPFGNSFGATGNSAFGNGTFGNGAFSNSASGR